MNDTSPEIWQLFCSMLRELPDAQRVRMGFGYSAFTRRLIREGLAREGLPTNGVEFARRLYPDLTSDVIESLRPQGAPLLLPLSGAD
ncbi:MAG TPA: hypothetical protein VF720_13820 [Candidatus Eisenbacteria bacterium]